MGVKPLQEASHGQNRLSAVGRRCWHSDDATRPGKTPGRARDPQRPEIRTPSTARADAPRSKFWVRGPRESCENRTGAPLVRAIGADPRVWHARDPLCTDAASLTRRAGAPDRPQVPVGRAVESHLRAGPGCRQERIRGFGPPVAATRKARGPDRAPKGSASETCRGSGVRRRRGQRPDVRGRFGRHERSAACGSSAKRDADSTIASGATQESTPEMDVGIRVHSERQARVAADAAGPFTGERLRPTAGEHEAGTRDTGRTRAGATDSHLYNRRLCLGDRGGSVVAPALAVRSPLARPVDSGTGPCLFGHAGARSGARCTVRTGGAGHGGNRAWAWRPGLAGYRSHARRRDWSCGVRDCDPAARFAGRGQGGRRAAADTGKGGAVRWRKTILKRLHI